VERILESTEYQQYQQRVFFECSDKTTTNIGRGRGATTKEATGVSGSGKQDCARTNNDASNH
jgi:hypothetical protein